MLRLFTILTFPLLLLQYSKANIDSTLIDSSKSLNNRGIKHAYNEDLQNAETYFKASLKLKEIIYNNAASISLAKAYNNIGVIKMRKWEYDSALFWFTKAEETYQLFEDTEVNIANVNTNRGKVYMKNGDYPLSEQLYHSALSALNGLYSEEAILRRSEIYIRLGLLEIKKGNVNKAIKWYYNAMPNYNQDKHKSDLINLYIYIADAYLVEFQFKESLTAYKSALQLLNHDLNINRHKEAYILQKLALLNSHLNNINEAFNYITEAKEILNKLSIDSLNYINLHNAYAIIFANFNQYDSATFYCNTALDLMCTGSHKDIYKTPKIEDFNNIFKGISQLKSKAEYLIRWNKIEPNTNKLTAALEALKTATRLIDISRNSYLSVESKLLLAENESPIYNLGLMCAHTLFKDTKEEEYLETAFYFAEKSKSSVLVSVLQEEKAKSIVGIPDSLLNKENELKREVTFYKEQIYEESLEITPNNKKLDTWRNYLLSYTRKQNELIALLENNYPEYYALKYKQNTPTIKDVQEVIDENTTIIEYTLTDSVLYVFNIQKNESSLFEVKTDSLFLASVYDFLNSFKKFSYLNQGKSTFLNFEKMSHDLYKSLLAPYHSNELTEHLIIIPDDVLSYIPFETLVTKISDDQLRSYDKLNYLLKKHAISYSYSSSLLYESSSESKRKFYNKLLAIAPEYDSVNTENLLISQRNARSNSRDNLQDLPYAIDEAKAISSLTRGKSYLKKNATEKNFINTSGKYDILHLAMHTIIDDNNPLYSKLVFYDKDYKTEEGLLTTSEIFGLKLKAKMTVLSSCSSGDGEFKRGEGVLSLARGFFYAGCPSLIMTLWQVDDESGLILMKYYYKYLMRGYSKSSALQKAKLEYIESVPNEKRHPFYWSTYICIGNTSPIYYPRNHFYYLALTISLLASLLVVVYKRRKKVILTDPDL